MFGKEYAIISIVWGNPYTRPPVGAPRILFGMSCPWPTTHRAELMDLVARQDRPPGYTVAIWFRSREPIKRWSPERMAAVRMRNL